MLFGLSLTFSTIRTTDILLAVLKYAVWFEFNLLHYTDLAV